MTATQGGPFPATDATHLPINFELFDEKCREQGATTEPARAELVDVDRTTLWRWRSGRQTPSLEVAKRIARQFDVTVEELTGSAA